MNDLDTRLRDAVEPYAKEFGWPLAILEVLAGATAAIGRDAANADMRTTIRRYADGLHFAGRGSDERAVRDLLKRLETP